MEVSDSAEDGTTDIITEIYKDEKQKPKDRLGKCLKNVATMLTIINGLPNAMEQLQQLQTFLITNLK